jgi:putative colanic acid biosynthesis UDP-glucose lipid carrier transferase
METPQLKKEQSDGFTEKRTLRQVSQRNGGGQGYISSRPLTLVRLLEVLMDPVVAVLTLRAVLWVFEVPFDTLYLVFSVLLFLTSYIVFKESNLCRSWRSGGVRAQGKNTLVAWSLVLGILMVLGYLTKTSHLFSRPVIVVWAIVTPGAILAGHWLVRQVLFRVSESQRYIRDVVIVGMNDISRKLAREIQSDKRLSMSFEGFFDDRRPRDDAANDGEPFLGNLRQLPEYVKRHKVDLIYIALPMAQQRRILELLDGLRDTTASIYFAPELFMFDLIQGRVDEVNGIPVVAVCETPFYGINGLLKRMGDLFFASLILLAISPVLVMIALGVKLTSRGPVLFKQRRYGLDGEEMLIYKFRSMTVCEDGDAINQATRTDRRITKFGRFLRKTSLDELPQFFNVLQGRMSIVGPRPHAVAHNEMYRKVVKGYMVRHKVKPGITGWAQVNGLRGETDTLEKMKARVEYDLDYLRNWSLLLDTKIIFKTALMMFRDKNAY